MVAWTENTTGNVYVAPLESGAAPLLVGSTPGAWGVAMDANSVYWTTLAEGQVFAWPIAGGEPTALVEQAISPSDLAVSGDRVLFGTLSDSGVFSVPAAGGQATSLTPSGGFGVAADAEHAYFGTYDGRLARVPVGGGETQVLGIGAATPSDVAVTSIRVYWTSPASKDGMILMVAK
jgi:hypothetical protein